MSSFVADLRYAARSLKRSPGFFLLAVTTLAVGIGSTTALFTLVDAVLLRPLPFEEPHRLVEIWGRTGDRTGMRVPGVILEALRSRAKTLAVIGTHDPSGGVLNTAEGAIDIRGQTVSANFVDVFGVQPLIGRGFVPEDEQAGAPAVMLASFSFWQQYLGADVGAVGRTVYLDGVPHTVVGIMPREFRTQFADRRWVFWTPYAGSSSRVRERQLGYEVVARLAPGASVDQARQEIEAIASSIEVEGWGTAGRRLGLVPLRDEVVGNRAQALRLLLAAVVVVLAIACANIAQLLLARSDARLREFATRKALGARSSRVFRLALFESLLLSLAGGAAGVAFAYWLVPTLLALAPAGIPRLADAAVDGRVLAMALVTSLLTGCCSGVAPAWRLSRLSLTEILKPVSGLASRQRARLRSALLVLQVAAAVTLLALAGLVLQTFLTLFPSSAGFATESRSAFIWHVTDRQFPDASDRRRRVKDWMERLTAVPGVVAVATASGMPFGDDEPTNTAVRRLEDANPPDNAALRSDLRAVSLGYFQLLQVRLIQGRHFAPTDRAEAQRVALVNQTLAQRLESSGDVVGRSIRVGNAANSPIVQVVGVVADTRWWGMTLAPLNEVYVPLDQHSTSFGFLIVHSTLGVAELTAAIKRTFYAALPGAAVLAERQAVPLDGMIAGSVAGPRFSATLISAFSAAALLLAAIGLFGMVAYSVTQRRRELGVRVALGAQPGDLIMTTMRSAITLTAIGVASGVAAGAYLTRFVKSQLYAIEPLDPPTFMVAAAVMLMTAAVAAYLPARRAARADPMQSLRYE
jgi:putative ABC transport system permease protein